MPLQKLRDMVDWLHGYLQTKEGLLTIAFVGCSLAFGFWHGSNRYHAGERVQYSKDSVVFQTYNDRITKMDKNLETLNAKLANRDCSEELTIMQRNYRALVQNSGTFAAYEEEKARKDREARILAEKNAELEAKNTNGLNNIKNNLK